MDESPGATSGQLADPRRLRHSSENAAGQADADVRARSRDMAAGSPSIGHVSSENLSFGQALDRLRAGQKISRRGWNGRGQYVELQVPDLNSKMTLPYIFIRTVQGDLVPWLASQSDLLACDWLVVREQKVLVYGDERIGTA